MRLCEALMLEVELEECFSIKANSRGRAERERREEGEVRTRRVVSENSCPVEIGKGCQLKIVDKTL